MPRRGGKRIRMDDPPPLEYEDDIYRGAIGYGCVQKYYSIMHEHLSANPNVFHFILTECTVVAMTN